ncbi:hypothetical protein [Amycolatopsis sp. NPDC059657]|uniref:hypothetical protein n=1 Tax=Amycolatopsis sp. NPDC059657 TaxID=3346899 RepID=UPI00366EE683
MINRRGPARPIPRGRRTEWLALVIFGLAAFVLWLVLGNAWPWALALGVPAVAAMIGERRPGTLAVGFALADVWWLLTVPWWGWLLIVGTACLTVGLWRTWACWKTRHAVPALPPGIQPGVPPEGPNEITAPIRAMSGRWKLVTAFTTGVVLVAGGIVGWQLEAAAKARHAQDLLNAAHDAALPGILPQSGPDLVYYLIRAIAEREPRNFCFAVDPQPGRDFAYAHGADTCEQAIDNFSRRVPDGVRYRNATSVMVLPSGAVKQDGKRQIVDACHIRVDPPDAGPDSFGIFTMDQQRGRGSKITGFMKCLN